MPFGYVGYVAVEYKVFLKSFVHFGNFSFRKRNNFRAERFRLTVFFFEFEFARVDKILNGFFCDKAVCYVFDFIPFKEDMVERDIENALVKDVTALLLELGTGFAFLGNQYHLNVGGDDFYIDLLFYNLNLRCYVVIELKTGDFKPEYAGQLNFYLSAVDAQLKKDTDNPTIGLLLCKNKNNLVAEYSLKDMSKPMGISEYKISSVLPEELSQQLPSVEDIQKRIK